MVGAPVNEINILVVEDDPDAMKIVWSILTAAGYRVVQAYGGRDALRKLERHHIDLVVTDLAMPEMSGVELIRTIKQDARWAQIRVIAITAFAWDQYGPSAKQAGCDGFLPKPVSKDRLLREIESQRLALPHR
jgi:CheY-like chemotaxis protein